MDVDQGAASTESVLASDAERDDVVELLKERAADGTLTLDEFADRVDRALGARTRDQLDEVVRGLRARVRSDTARRSPRHSVVAVMGGAQTKGRWRCGDRVTAVAVMGGVHLDFRGAEIDSAEVHVTAVAVMGGVDIIVPEGVEVTMDGFPVMGGRSNKVKDVRPLPGAPRLVVHAFPIMGGITVRSRPRKGDSPLLDATTKVVPPRQPAEAAASSLDGTVTVMFSDVCDYSGITDRLGDEAAHDLLREHNRLIREQIEAHGGHEVKSNGDGFMVAFGSVARALRCAVSLQQRLAARNDGSRDSEPIRVHVGIHAGEVVRDGDDFLGTTVIVASRLADEAGPDEILVSSVARELAGGSREFAFGAPRTVTLKGFLDSRQAFPVKWE